MQCLLQHSVPSSLSASRPSEPASAAVNGRRCSVICGARREERSSRGPQVTTVTVQPTELACVETAKAEGKPLTVYSCRFSTGHGRGAALSDPMSYINVCLIGKDGRSVLHRISPVYDPNTAQQEVKEMCQLIDDSSVGADCPTALSQSQTQQTTTTTASGYTLPLKPIPVPRSRFQDGHVDEVVFLAPELGPLAGVLVGTESASWVLEELQIASSRTHHIDRFVCRRLLGSQPGQGSVFLSPVPAGTAVYGTGDLQMVLTKEQAATLHTLNMDAYQDLKRRLLTTTALLTASGTGVAGLVAGLEGALPFALGGLAGVAYQWLLQQGVDSIVATAGPTPPPTPKVNMQGVERPLSATATVDDPSVFIDFVEVDQDGTVIVQKRGSSPGQGQGSFPSARKLLGNPAVRLAFLAGLTALGISVLGSSVPEGTLGLPALQRDQLWQLVMGLLGFMTYKVAIITVSLSAPAQVDTVKATNVQG